MYTVLRFLVEMAKLYLLLRLIGYNVTKKLILPCCVAAVSLIAVLFLQNNVVYDTFILIEELLIIVCIAFLFQGRNKTIAVVLSALIIWFIDVFFENILTILFSGAISIFTEFVSLLILAAVFIALKILQKPPLLVFESFGRRQVLLFIIGLITFMIYIAPYQTAGLVNDTLQFNKFLAVLSAISGVFLIVISINAGQKHHYKEVANLTEKMRKDQEKYFQLLLSKEEETKKFRHDFKNHLYSIKYLLENGNTRELKQYVDDMDIVSAKLKPEILTGNDIINAIICELRESYKGVDYIIEWNGLFPNDVDLAPIDLSSIFYNLLSNAIEAIEKLPQEADRTISVKVKQSHSLLFVSIKNPCAAKAIKAGGGFATSKKDKGFHGIGSQNIALNVKKYNGEIKYNITENEFEAEISFYDLPLIPVQPENVAVCR